MKSEHDAHAALVAAAGGRWSCHMSAPADGVVRLSSLKSGECFQFEVAGPVFIKCRGGFRPARGGDLRACSPSQQVIRYGDRLSPSVR